MKRVLSFLKHYKKEAILGPLLKLAEACLDLLIPLLMAHIIDRGIGQEDSSYVVGMCLLLMGLGAVGLGLAVLAQYFSAKAAVGVAARLRRALFATVQGLSFSQLDKEGSSTLITRMTSDVNQVQSGLNLALRLLLRSPFIVFGSAVMALLLDARSTVIFLIAIPLLGAVVFAVLLISLPLYRKAQERLDTVTARTRENLTGVRVLRAFGREPEETAAFNAANTALTKAQLVAGRVTVLLNPLTCVIVNLAIVALIHTGALRVEAGLLTQGAVVALYNYMAQILVELIKLANLIISITRSVACAKRVNAVLCLPSETPAAGRMTGHSGAVTFENVSFTYEGDSEPALADISFTAAPGETVGIIGGTGSGKTTLVNLIPGFYTAAKGRVLVGGQDVRGLDPVALRETVGMVPQTAVLFRGTIRDNLLWGNPAADDTVLNEALAAAQAADVVAARPAGLDAPVEQGGKNFSGGQRQRLTIARALVRRPALLILDDSASALDHATEARLRQSLRQLPYDPTVLIVSQRTSSLRHADRILVLDDGRLVGTGTHEQLMDTCPVYREIHLSQTKEVSAHG